MPADLTTITDVDSVTIDRHRWWVNVDITTVSRSVRHIHIHNTDDGLTVVSLRIAVRSTDG